MVVSFFASRPTFPLRSPNALRSNRQSDLEGILALLRRDLDSPSEPLVFLHSRLADLCDQLAG